jgi:hypothetical protein
MPGTLDEYRARLITNILCAVSQEEVRRLCLEALEGLKDKGMNGHLIVRFLEKTNQELAAFNPMNKNSLQWSNIINAKVYCNRLMQQYSFSHE